MKLILKLLAGAVISSVVSLSTSAQHPLVNDGSIASRAPLPMNQPWLYRTVNKASSTGGTVPVLVANHQGQPVPLIAMPIEPTQLFAISPMIQVYPLSPPSPVAPVLVVPNTAAGAALGATAMGAQIRSDATVSREQLLDIEARVAVSDQSMATTRNTMPALNAEGQAQFNSANRDVQTKGDTLRNSIDTARNTNGEQLAIDFEAYAAAVARVDRIALAQR